MQSPGGSGLRASESFSRRQKVLQRTEDGHWVRATPPRGAYDEQGQYMNDDRHHPATYNQNPYEGTYGQGAYNPQNAGRYEFDNVSVYSPTGGSPRSPSPVSPMTDAARGMEFKSHFSDWTMTLSPYDSETRSEDGRNDEEGKNYGINDETKRRTSATQGLIKYLAHRTAARQLDPQSHSSSEPLRATPEHAEAPNVYYGQSRYPERTTSLDLESTTIGGPRYSTMPPSAPPLSGNIPISQLHRLSWNKKGKKRANEQEQPLPQHSETPVSKPVGLGFTVPDLDHRPKAQFVSPAIQIPSIRYSSQSGRKYVTHEASDIALRTANESYRGSSRTSAPQGTASEVSVPLIAGESVVDDAEYQTSRYTSTQATIPVAASASVQGDVPTTRYVNYSHRGSPILVPRLAPAPRPQRNSPPLPPSARPPTTFDDIVPPHQGRFVTLADLEAVKTPKRAKAEKAKSRRPSWFSRLKVLSTTCIAQHREKRILTARKTAIKSKISSPRPMMGTSGKNNVVNIAVENGGVGGPGAARSLPVKKGQFPKEPVPRAEPPIRPERPKGSEVTGLKGYGDAERNWDTRFVSSRRAPAPPAQKESTAKSGQRQDRHHHQHHHAQQSRNEASASNPSALSTTASTHPRSHSQSHENKPSKPSRASKNEQKHRPDPESSSDGDTEPITQFSDIFLGKQTPLSSGAQTPGPARERRRSSHKSFFCAGIEAAQNIEIIPPETPRTGRREGERRDGRSKARSPRAPTPPPKDPRYLAAAKAFSNSRASPSQGSQSSERSEPFDLERYMHPLGHPYRYSHLQPSDSHTLPPPPKRNPPPPPPPPPSKTIHLKSLTRKPLQSSSPLSLLSHGIIIQRSRQTSHRISSNTAAAHAVVAARRGAMRKLTSASKGKGAGYSPQKGSPLVNETRASRLWDVENEGGNCYWEDGNRRAGSGRNRGDDVGDAGTLGRRDRRKDGAGEREMNVSDERRDTRFYKPYEELFLEY